MKRILLFIVIGMLIAPNALPADELKTSQSIEVKASADQVWALIKAVDQWADWNPAVKEARLTQGDGEAVGSKVDFRPVIAGKTSPVKVKLTLAKSEKPNLLEYTSKSAGMNIVFGFRIEEKDGLATVTSYETITGPGSGLFKMLFSQEGLDQEHREWVEAIKAKLEHKKSGGGG